MAATSVTLPLVSVVIPAYNAEIYIEETLESVISQTYPNIEILVVDDGSTDRTTEIVRLFIEKDQRIILLEQPNAGVATARNLAIQHAKGDYIAPVDADDIWFPQKLEKQVQLMLESNSSVGVVYTWSVLIDEMGSLLEICQTSTLENETYIPLVNANFLGNASSPLIRSKCLEQIGTYNCQMKAQNAQGCEDWDIYLRIAQYYQFRVVPEILVGYRQIPNSMSFNDVGMQRSYNMMIADVKQRHPELPAQLYRWSESRFHWYSALKTSQCGQHWRTIRYLLAAASLDYLPLLHPRFYSLLIVSFFAILTKPITSVIWSNHQKWLGFLQRFKLLKQTHYAATDRDKAISELRYKYLKKHQSFPRKQLNQLQWNRWTAITHKMQDLSQKNALKKTKPTQNIF